MLAQAPQYNATSRYKAASNVSSNINANARFLRNALFVPLHSERQIESWRVRSKLLPNSVKRVSRIDGKPLSVFGNIKIQNRRRDASRNLRTQLHEQGSLPSSPDAVKYEYRRLLRRRQKAMKHCLLVFAVCESVYPFRRGIYTASRLGHFG